MTPPATLAAGAVAAGAVVGASARWAVGEALGAADFPWATLVVNVIGCAAIGWFATRLQPGSAAWCFVITGCLGGLTTASAFGAETRQLVDDGRSAVALAYVVVSVAGGLTAVVASRRWAQREPA